MRTRQTTPLLRRRCGAAIVEMAVVAPLFFLMVLTMIEFARMMMVQQALTNAAREGCRTAALTTTNSSSAVDTAVRNQLQSTITSASDTGICRVTITPASMTGIAEDTEIAITVEVNYADVSWLPPSFLGSAVLRGKATMKRE